MTAIVLSVGIPFIYGAGGFFIFECYVALTFSSCESSVSWSSFFVSNHQVKEGGGMSVCAPTAAVLQPRQCSLPILVFLSLPGEDVYDPKYQPTFQSLGLQAEWSGVGVGELQIFSGNDIETFLGHAASCCEEYSRAILFFERDLPENVDRILSKLSQSILCDAYWRPDDGIEFSQLSYTLWRPAVAHG